MSELQLVSHEAVGIGTDDTLEVVTFSSISILKPHCEERDRTSGRHAERHEKMERRPDHRRGHRHLGERLQRLHLREEQGETTSVDTPATSEAGRGRRENSELLHVSALALVRH